MYSATGIGRRGVFFFFLIFMLLVLAFVCSAVGPVLCTRKFRVLFCSLLFSKTMIIAASVAILDPLRGKRKSKTGVEGRNATDKPSVRTCPDARRTISTA